MKKKNYFYIVHTLPSGKKIYDYYKDEFTKDISKLSQYGHYNENPKEELQKSRKNLEEKWNTPTSSHLNASNFSSWDGFEGASLDLIVTSIVKLNIEDLYIRHLTIDVRTYTLLKKCKIETIGNIINYGKSELKKFKGIGPEAIIQITEALSYDFGITLN